MRRCFFIRVPDAARRATSRRRAGTQSRADLVDAWAPARQRNAKAALRCVRGTEACAYRFRFTNACISRVGSSVRNDSPKTLTLRSTDSVSGSSSH